MEIPSPTYEEKSDKKVIFLFFFSFMVTVDAETTSHLAALIERTGSFSNSVVWFRGDTEEAHMCTYDQAEGEAEGLSSASHVTCLPHKNRERHCSSTREQMNSGGV